MNECEHRCRERSVDSTMFERAGKYDWRTQDLRQSWRRTCVDFIIEQLSTVTDDSNDIVSVLDILVTPYIICYHQRGKRDMT